MGSVARAQVLEALNNHRGQEPIAALLPETVHRIQERATLAEALGEMNRYGVTYLLVCRGDIAVGVVGSSDIIHAYKNVE